MMYHPNHTRWSIMTSCATVRFCFPPGDGVSTGARLVDESAVSAIENSLFPLVTVVTPNLRETEVSNEGGHHHYHHQSWSS